MVQGCSDFMTVLRSLEPVLYWCLVSCLQFSGKNVELLLSMHVI